MSFKPVYVPKSKRTSVGKQQQHRRGPQQYFDDEDADAATPPPPCIDPSAALSKVQRPEDFMDEQDHNEWGGPTKVTAEFDHQREPKRQTVRSGGGAEEEEEGLGNNGNPLGASLMTVRSLHAGERLLRQLGWRDSSSTTTSSTTTTAATTAAPPSFLTAYLPATGSGGGGARDNEDTTATLIKVGTRHLRKIVLQQTRVAIPPPWKGKWGLGYQSELRTAAGAVSGKSSSRQPYRLSNVIVRASGVIEPGRRADHNNHHVDDSYYEATTTLQDFVGTHSTAGFALREDEDDAYDDSMGHEKSFHSTVLSSTASSSSQQQQAQQQRRPVDPASLQMEAYEHQDSDSDGDDGKHHQKKKAAAAGDFAGALSTWAMGGDTATGASSSTTTSNRPSFSSSALEGFVLGVTSTAATPKLYRGPDVPRDWHITPHQFGPNEHPTIFKAIAHATKLAVAQERRQQSMAEALEAATVGRQQMPQLRQQQQEQQQNSRPSIFSGIGEQMKNRFTAAASDEAPQQQQQEGTIPARSTTTHPTTEQVTMITRTIKPFLPDPLLCKRLNVSAPKLAAGGGGESGQEGGDKSTTMPLRRDEVFFQTQVLGAVAEESRKRAAETASSTAALLFLNDDDDDEGDQPKRPPLDVYKSIFDPDNTGSADDDADHVEINDCDESKLAITGNVQTALVPYREVTDKPSSPTQQLLSDTNSALVPFSDPKSDPDDRSALSSSSASSSSSLADHDRRRRDRKRKHAKKSSKTKKSKKHRKKKSKKERRTTR